MSDFTLRNILLGILVGLYGLIGIFSLEKVHNIFVQYALIIVLPIVCICMMFII